MNQTEIKAMLNHVKQVQKMATKTLADIEKSLTPKQAVEMAKEMQRLKDSGIVDKINSFKWQ
jgi:hypothetical protein